MARANKNTTWHIKHICNYFPPLVTLFRLCVYWFQRFCFVTDRRKILANSYRTGQIRQQMSRCTMEEKYDKEIINQSQIMDPRDDLWHPRILEDSLTQKMYRWVISQSKEYMSDEIWHLLTSSIMHFPKLGGDRLAAIRT